ncbi:MAG: hypothetical protein ACI9KE_005459 [Polyangiales bacterium]
MTDFAGFTLGGVGAGLFACPSQAKPFITFAVGTAAAALTFVANVPGTLRVHRAFRRYHFTVAVNVLRTAGATEYARAALANEVRRAGRHQVALGLRIEKAPAHHEESEEKKCWGCLSHGWRVSDNHATPEGVLFFCKSDQAFIFV